VSSASQAFFLPASSGNVGQRFCTFHLAQGTLRGRVVYVHPFAEEMNKSRRMAAIQARALAAAGFSVLQIDLHGCGDSSGDFGDASWQSWVDDVLFAVAWLRDRDAAHAQAPLWLWGLRAGCLLAGEAAALIEEPCNFLLWQPSMDGSKVLQQFLRLRLAGDLLSSGKGLMDTMRQQLAQGQALEIAGYSLTPALAQGLEKSRLTLPQTDRPSRVEWFEISSRDGATISPAAVQAQAQWSAASYQVNSHVVQGPQFWQTTEIEDALALISATLSAVLAEPPCVPQQLTPA
jgi:exosortase A-associated hydrolase 2